MKPSEIIFVLIWLFGVFAFFRSFALQVKAAKRTTSGKHWWFHMNSLDPILNPGAWTSEGRAIWRQHLLWAAIFVGSVGSLFLVARIAEWPNAQ